MSLPQRVKHGLLPHVLALERAKQCMQFISRTVEVSGLAATASAGLYERSHALYNMRND